MEIVKTHKPTFHVTGEQGWINDPNGLIFFNNQYHAFFQHYPHDTKWGPMHWGHVVSNDLTNWKYLPIALAPGGKGDKDGCFSGSAIVHDGKLWLLYTGYEYNSGGESIRQVQCLAESADGVHFVKHGVVIGTDLLPSDYAPCDFRDPKVWFANGSFWCIVAARKIAGRGRILLYKSADLFNWEFVNDLFGKDSAGTMIECPDYNQELGYLLFCEQYQPSENGIHLNVHTCRYCIGHIDYRTGRFVEQSRDIVDYGFDMYAPQSFVGKPVLMGWLNMWDRNVPSADYGFAGMLTVARKVSVVDGRLWQEPIVPCAEVRRASGGNAMQDKVVEGVLKISATNLQNFQLTLRSNGTNCTKLTLQDGKWVFDRSNSGASIVGVEQDQDSLAGIRKMPISNNKQVELTIVLDKYSVEIFQDGRAMTSTIYPPHGADDLHLSIQADNWHYTRYQICTN